jgi:protein gp37
VPHHPYQQGFDLRLIPEKLFDPFLWSRSCRVFVNSMSDLFQEDVPDEYIINVARVMEATPWHTYQVLTKRSRRMKELLQTKLKFAAKLSHIWWGVSVEDQKYGLPRMKDLKASCASVKFLSVEPLLEDLGEVNFDGIHWVIVGGESGPGARKMEAAWVTHLLAQCRSARVPFFFKQWGGVQKKKHGRNLDGKTYDESPELQVTEIPDRIHRKKAAEFLQSVILPFQYVTKTKSPKQP